MRYDRQAMNYVKICPICGCEIYYSIIIDKNTGEVLSNSYPSCCPNCLMVDVKQKGNED